MTARGVFTVNNGISLGAIAAMFGIGWAIVSQLNAADRELLQCTTEAAHRITSMEQWRVDHERELERILARQNASDIEIKARLQRIEDKVDRLQGGQK